MGRRAIFVLVRRIAGKKEVTENPFLAQSPERTCRRARDRAWAAQTLISDFSVSVSTGRRRLVKAALLGCTMPWKSENPARDFCLLSARPTDKEVPADAPPGRCFAISLPYLPCSRMPNDDSLRPAKIPSLVSSWRLAQRSLSQRAIRLESLVW